MLPLRKEHSGFGVHILFAISSYFDGVKAPMPSVYITHLVFVFILRIKSYSKSGILCLFSPLGLCVG